MSKMNHNFIPNHSLSLKQPFELVHGLRLGLPSFVGHSLNVIVFERNPLASFSSCFSLRFVKQLKANFLIGFSKHASTFPDPSRMLHLSHLRTFYHS